MLKLACPWCRRADFESSQKGLADLKRHVKYCSFAPRPRALSGTKRAEKLCARTTENLFGIEKEKP